MRLLRAWKRRRRRHRLAKAVSAGEKTINEARAELGLPPWVFRGYDDTVTWREITR